MAHMSSATQQKALTCIRISLTSNGVPTLIVIAAEELHDIPCEETDLFAAEKTANPSYAMVVTTMDLGMKITGYSSK